MRLASHCDVLRQARHFAVDLTVPEWRLRYLVQPLEAVPTVIQDRTRRLGLMRWGWLRRANETGAPITVIRSEDAPAKCSRAFVSRRCIVSATAMYFATKGLPGTPDIWAVLPNRGHPIGLAALWQSEGVGDNALAAVALLTNNSPADLTRITPRLPAMLLTDSCDQWLDPKATHTQLRRLLQPIILADLDAFQVAHGVWNRSDEEGAWMLEPTGRLPS